MSIEEMSFEDTGEHFHLREEDGFLHVRFAHDDVDATAINDFYELMGDLEDNSTVCGVVFHLRPPGPPVQVSGRFGSKVTALGPNEGLRSFTRLEKALNTIERINKPSILVLDGAIGSVGLEMALVSDMRIATPRTSFQIHAVKRGFMPGMSLYRLARFTGLGTAKRVLLHGDPLDAREALKYGILDRVVPEPAETVRAAMEMLREIPPEALSMARRLLHELGSMDYRQAFEAYKAAQFHSLHNLRQDP